MMHPLNKKIETPHTMVTPKVSVAPTATEGGVVVDEQYPVTLDEQVTLQELLLAGNYDSYIADEVELQRIFEVDPRTHEIVIEPLCFDHPCTLEDMLEEMTHLGYRGATLRELLAIGAQHPELQRRKVLVALGSAHHETYIHPGDTEWTLDNVLHVPVLADVLGERMLILGEYDGKYRPGYYFLCVKLTPADTTYHA